ncbi:type IV toxin-antitoxin system AbiEi family antitoxin domain-containing protein [Bifidobacterium tibiigranuli]|jgi:predicted transcriptional regulator of viral defense system|uniref:type IV toxin-antitoxin system AbiEi family antitoxin domain-containing protein n=1 Tax=Bifidobacterium tibiigranuli TaxID=2172043 RepID=UPI0026EA0C48|nr:type IV toxin-antitoxin system AbiEi family antitoxin domain-containing protein [Bifidobacterium tibiigranuli]MCI1649040.1 type IV toxin-antitoxin system AbiEi family antitoxin domain-containing protein [Bifidobacterium tibiigranuli]MCI1673207.1 type IV toxin-antitoxin system AbiEi family antitoxin domain-containing protein [Bifidobacterium tibiigranuli]MCI1713548.1 type IV toxin-antitoxin system AbiEi family antitoxin domain-containing protein [Bifidobacterium tibiigranuli]MCI2186275.1 type
MSESSMVLALAQNNKGMVTSAMVQDAGIARQYLKILVARGLLERIDRGVYVLPDAWADEFVVLQSRFKKGVFSLETALFLHDLTDRTPVSYAMTFPENYNVTNTRRDGVLAHRATRKIYSSGVVKVTTPAGNQVAAYSAEKTLCDILRPKNGIESGVAAEAFTRYMSRKNRDIPQLSAYAKLLKVEQKVRSYLEVLQ